MEPDRRKEVIDIWKAVVEVQKHFNDIEMRIRTLFVTMVLAIVAAQGFLMEKGLSFERGETRVLYATFVPLLGVVGTFLFYFMDRYWYHRLLVGAVLHGISIEKRYEEAMPELSLSDSIGKASPITLNLWITRMIARLVVRDPKYKTTNLLHSDGKIELFYKPIAYLFVFTFFATFLFAGVLVRNEPIGFFLWAKVASAIWTP